VYACYTSGAVLGLFGADRRERSQAGDYLPKYLNRKIEAKVDRDFGNFAKKPEVGQM
jgi:hypothetical protein